MKKFAGTIDLTPTWKGIMPAALEAYKNVVIKMSKVKKPWPEGDAAIQIFEENLANMMAAADEWVAHQKKMETSITIRWCIEDVIEQARTRGKYVSPEDAIKILHEAKRLHDCDYGISWQTLDSYTDDLLPDPKGWDTYSIDDDELTHIQLNNMEWEDEVIGVVVNSTNKSEWIRVHDSGKYSTDFIGTPAIGTLEQCINAINVNK